MPGILIQSDFIPVIAQWGRFYYSHFSDTENIEPQRDSVTCLRPPGCKKQKHDEDTEPMHPPLPWLPTLEYRTFTLSSICSVFIKLK